MGGYWSLELGVRGWDGYLMCAGCLAFRASFAHASGSESGDKQTNQPTDQCIAGGVAAGQVARLAAKASGWVTSTS